MIRHWRRACFGLILAGVLLGRPAAAIEPQYRRVTLVDGRVLSAEILATEAKGLRMRVPAGEILVSFELLLDMVPISQSEYAAQPPWVVYFSVPASQERELVELVQAMEGMTPQPVSVAANGVTTAMAAKAGSCEDMGCLVGAVSKAPWMWVLYGSEGEGGVLKLQVKLNTSPDAPFEATVPAKDRDELWRVLHEALGLSVQGAAPKGSEAAKPEPNASVDERKIAALSFVPVPGLPSILQGDGAGAAIAAGIFVPSAAVWAVGVRQVAGTNKEALVATAAGLYAALVFTNHVTGMRSLERERIGVTAAPMGQKAAGVIVDRSF